MAGARDRGVALLNALVVAAAIAGVATLLMRTAETGRDRLSMIRNSDQMALYLDAVALVVPRILKADWSDGAALDHLGEIWASEDYSFPIDRGVAAGRISDLQGRFNVNWLSDPDDRDAVAIFGRLLDTLDLSPRLATTVPDVLARRMPGGRLRLVSELGLAGGMDRTSLARLAPHLAALPPETALNVNTATLPVLAAVLPGAGPSALGGLVADRRATPFASVGDFRNRVERRLGAHVLRDIGGVPLAVNSDWFEAAFEVALEDTVRARRLILFRTPQSGRVSVHMRLEAGG